MILALAALAVQAKFQEIRPHLIGHTPILTFHDVIERRGSDSVWFDCTVSEFKEILDWLRARKAAFISLDQLYRHLTRGEPLPKNAVAITFADNYRGFYSLALPILRQRHIPTAMFVHTGFVGSTVGRPKMTWDELKELDREGLVTVASQTVTHPPDLRTLSAARQSKEMTESKRELERQLGHPARYLAYPNGKFNATSMKAAREAGYAMAFSEELAEAERSPSILAINRYVHTKWRQAFRNLQK